MPPTWARSDRQTYARLRIRKRSTLAQIASAGKVYQFFIAYTGSYPGVNEYTCVYGSNIYSNAQKKTAVPCSLNNYVLYAEGG